jgi:hypothetical protein
LAWLPGAAKMVTPRTKAGLAIVVPGRVDESA